MGWSQSGYWHRGLQAPPWLLVPGASLDCSRTGARWTEFPAWVRAAVWVSVTRVEEQCVPGAMYQRGPGLSVT